MNPTPASGSLSLFCLSVALEHVAAGLNVLPSVLLNFVCSQIPSPQAGRYGAVSRTRSQDHIGAEGHSRYIAPVVSRGTMAPSPTLRSFSFWAPRVPRYLAFSPAGPSEC